jgi:hypothetical protein
MEAIYNQNKKITLQCPANMLSLLYKDKNITFTLSLKISFVISLKIINIYKVVTENSSFIFREEYKMHNHQIYSEYVTKNINYSSAVALSSSISIILFF